MPTWVQTAILAIGFTLGVALMGVQMATSRILAPYFGGDIEVWASLISTVMLALMAGYFIGGRIADRFPRSDVLGLAVLVGGLYLLAVPFVATSALDAMIQTLPPEAWSNKWTTRMLTLAAAAGIMLPPLTLLSFFSPYAVRLLLVDAEHGGRVAGAVYSITTVGNIVGTLGTALYLMEVLGSRDTTLMFAAVIVVCGVLLILLRSRAAAD
ncbi:MAG: hypothetical protein GC206_09800 [Alphaproteobacteria bacterium]|nr:hypothetical protein [Alphaproteobacteria bacterium]